MKDIDIKHFSSSLSWASQPLEAGYRIEVSQKEFYEGGYRSTRMYTYFIEYTKAASRAAALVIALKDVRGRSLRPTEIERAIVFLKKSDDNQLSLSFDS